MFRGEKEKRRKMKMGVKNAKATRLPDKRKASGLKKMRTSKGANKIDANAPKMKVGIKHHLGDGVWRQKNTTTW